MAMVSSFGAFTTARLGIYAAQQGLSVTGNNISNINTPGYTRQVLDQVSLYNKGSDRYVTAFGATRIGNGALITGVSQMRDPFLDIRYRTEVARVGYTDETVYGLDQIAAIIDEVGKGDDEHGILEAALSEFRTRLNNLNTNTGENSFDTQVRTAASSLTRLFNSYSDQLSKLESNTQRKLDQDVESVNNILKNIRDLNDAIRKSDIHGDKALEQRDERNRLIDELAKYMKIDASYSMEDIGGGVKVEKLTIRLDGANAAPDQDHTDMTVLVDGVYAAQLTVDGKEPAEDADAKTFIPYQFHVSELRDKHNDILEYKDHTKSEPVDLKDNDLYGSLQATRELLTEAGDFATKTMLDHDPDAASKRGIPYYQQSLDLLARQFAEAFNAANQGYLTDMEGNLVTKEKIEDPANPGKMIEGTVLLKDGDGNPIKASDLSAAELAKWADEGKIIPQGGVLFSNGGNSNDTEDPKITAANISVAKDWADSKLRIVRSFKVLDGKLEPESTDGDNIRHMITMMDEKRDFIPSTVNDLVDPDVIAEKDSVFNGSFQEMLTKIASTLGGDQKTNNTLLNNYYLSAIDLDTSRDSVSSVDLNDEATNLIQYQKAYAAACRVMTTLDEALDKLINGTGVVGR